MQSLKELGCSRNIALKNVRSRWLATCKDISSYIHPYSGMFSFTSQKGERRDENIIDNTAMDSLNVLTAGLMSNMTSPARPWFRIGTPDPELMKFLPVKKWLNDLTILMHMVYNRSNVYRSLHYLYEEISAYGTSAVMTLDDYDTVVHDFNLQCGEYCLAQNWKGVVDTMYREFEMSVSSVVREFGLDACSGTIRRLYNDKKYDVQVKILHFIDPREDRNISAGDSKNMAWRSVYIELGGDEDKVLRESGFKQFPVQAPRWKGLGNFAYGVGPGIVALGDSKALQHEHIQKALAIEYITNPPLQAPSSVKGYEMDTLPGGITFVDQLGPQSGLRTAFDVNVRINELIEDIHDVRDRIRRAFFTDLFLMLANDTRSGTTAYEVAQRHEEKLQMLGPVVERLDTELIRPKISITFGAIVRAGILPPPPQELMGQELQVELVSLLAQAQRAVGNATVDKFLGAVAQVAQFKPDVLDKFNSDAWYDIYGENMGVDPRFTTSDDDLGSIREQRAKQAEAAQQSALMNQGADTAARLATAKTDESNGLTDMMRNLTGYS